MENTHINRFTFLVQSPETVCNRLKSLLMNERFSDVVLRIQGTDTKIPAHRQILAAASDYWASSLFGPYVEGSSREILISDVSEQDVVSLLEFIYTGSVHINNENLVPLLKAADMLCIDSAKAEFFKAAQYIIDNLGTSEENIAEVLNILNSSYYCHLTDVYNLCMEYIDIHTSEVMQSEAFLLLPYEILEEILRRDTLNDGLNEIQIYLGCLRWARGFGGITVDNLENFSVQKIQPDNFEKLKNLIENIRLPLISASYIIKHIEPTGLIEKDKLYIAIAYHAAPDCYPIDNQACFRARVGSLRPWSWSEAAIGPHILLSQDKRAAEAHYYNWEKVLGAVEWHAGKHSFTAVLDMNFSASTNSWQIIIGVANSNTELSGHLGSMQKEWGMACGSGLRISNGDIREEYATSCKKGDRITVCVDCTKKTLEFYRNGISLGIAFTNIVTPVSPAVSLLKGQRVSLVFD